MQQLTVGNKKYSTDSELITADAFRSVIMRGLNLGVSDLINWFDNTQFWDVNKQKYFKANLKIEQTNGRTKK